MERDVLRELQLKGLEMLLYFQKFCEKNDLTFYMCGGCCIGALRSGGFIPWDDDVDLFMPRKDYEKLKTLWPLKADTAKYVCEYPEQGQSKHNLFINIRDVNTTFIKPYQTELELAHGVPLDILPLDGCPDKKLARKAQIIWAKIYSLFCAQVVPENHGRLMRMLAKTAFCLVRSQKARYRIWRYAEKKMTRYDIEESGYITELCSGPKYMHNRFRSEWFGSGRLESFEGYMLPVPLEAEKYVETVFGDYRILPPENKRVPSHDYVYLDLNNPYTNYKGIYYCKGANDA